MHAEIFSKCQKFGVYERYRKFGNYSATIQNKDSLKKTIQDKRMIGYTYIETDILINKRNAFL